MWRKLLPVFFFFTLVDGFISNLLYPSKLALLYKDIFLILIFFLFVIKEDFRRVIRDIRWSFGDAVFLLGAAFMGWTCLQIFNPNSPVLLLGLLGLKTYFLYWLMTPLCYTYVRKKEDVWHFLRMMVLFSIPVNIFGMVQFQIGPEFLIVFGHGFARAFSEAALQGYGGEGVKSFYRIIGTFASTGQYSNFLCINSMFCLGLVYMAPTLKKRALWGSALVLNVLAMLSAGSRGAVLMTGAMVFAFVILSKRLKSSLFVVAAIGLFFYFGLSFLGGGVQARFQTLQDFAMVQDRTVNVTGGTLVKYFDENPLGRGPGSASTSARHLDTGASRNPSWTLVENWPAKLQVETGFPGVIIFFLFTFTLGWRWWKNWYARLDGECFNYGGILTAFGLPYLFLISLFGILDTPPGYIYLWAAVGMVAKLAVLSERDRYAYDNYAPTYD